ncbi:MAG: aminopeptidase [gamma proteobacterium endosymbiont of Lamellibrachia anaximandri]|nr:aminopeptidase [gamma proteobacterium endosymbiont of Lamellibrachia anaximandri]MBL3533783.1 aminopeptidase [gamma proteobacterium endosymbiont of Lamellibrachia anaximandri]
MQRTEPITDLLDNPQTDPQLKQQLQLVETLRDFASQALKLPENESYRSYTDLQRKAVVWSVIAAPEFSIHPKQWCYPVVGCASYRGYFSKAEATAYANQLKDEGLDVTIADVPAYSTLGWFDDPLPSTVIHWPETSLAQLIFHELAHQQLYLQGDSAFNEAFATAVAQLGVDQWLRTKQKATSAWQQQQFRHEEFTALLLKSRKALETLYEKEMTESEMRDRKAGLFSQLRQDYQQLKLQWNGLGRYDRWFDKPINNASLAQIATYYRLVPGFLDLFEQQNRDWNAFYQACTKLSTQSETERMAALTDKL